MSGLKFTAGTKKGRACVPLSVATLLLLLCGVYGVLLLLHGVEAFSFSLFSTFLTAGVAGTALWAAFSYRRKLFYVLLGCVPLLCGLLVFFGWEEVLREGTMLVRGLSGLTQEANLPLLAFLFSLLLTVLLFLLECCLRFHVPAMLLSVVLLMISPLLGISIEIGTVFLLVLFQLGFWAYNAAGQKGSRVPSKGRLAGGGVRLCLRRCCCFRRWSPCRLPTAMNSRSTNLFARRKGLCGITCATSSVRKAGPSSAGRSTAETSTTSVPVTSNLRSTASQQNPSICADFPEENTSAGTGRRRTTGRSRRRCCWGWISVFRTPRSISCMRLPANRHIPLPST